MLNSYFTSLLSEPLQDRSQATKEILGAILSLVTGNQNALFLREFIKQEIEETVFSMATNKAPRPDGFTIEFFKVCWPIIKAHLLIPVRNFHKTKKVLPAINATFLTLIPKSNQADSPDKFCPITLCNVLYKILSKLMDNRLKSILPSIISKSTLATAKEDRSMTTSSSLRRYCTLSKQIDLQAC